MQDGKIKRMLKQNAAVHEGFERAHEINKRDAEHYNNLPDEKKLEFAINARKQELYHKKQAELERQNNNNSGKAFYEKWIDDLCDAGRMFVGKANDLLMDEDLADLDNVQQNIEAMKKIATYKKLINDRDVAQREYDRAVQMYGEFEDRDLVAYGKIRVHTNPDNTFIQQASNKLDDINNRIKELDNYFLGEGRNNPVVAELMYDINKMSGGDMSYINARSIQPESVTTFDDFAPHSLDEWYKPITGAAGTIMDVLKYNVGALTWGGEKIQQGIANTFGSNYMDGATTRRTLGKLDLNDENDAKFINNIYKGSQLNVRDINNTIDDSIVGYVDEKGEYHGGDWLNAYNKQAGEIAESVAEHMLFAKTGKIWGIDIYDPEDINPLFKEEHDHYGESNWDIIAHPLHAFAESASTVMSMRHQFGAMGVDAISNALAKRVPALAIASELASMGSHIAATEVSRNRETASEKINALSDRILTDYVTNGGDLTSLVNTLEDGLKHAGVDTEGLDGQQIIKLGVAYNIITDDKNFEKVKFESRKGINKLVNSNNALAVMDYLQTLPFMSYGGKALNRFLGKKVVGVADNAIANKAMSELEKKYASTLSGMVDHYIDKAALKFFKNDVEKVLMARSVGKYLTKKAELVAFEGISEGLEESQQEILQARFKSGAYDNYNRRESAFDLDEVINNFKLFREGVGFTLNSGAFLSSILGIDPNDPLNGSSEIRKAFNVGMASSLIFGAGSHALTNITQYQSDDQRNITSLIKNIKDDAIIANIVGANQKSAQDQQHIGIFYDAFDKGGMNAARLNERLNFLKETVNGNRTLATKEDIDADKKLLNAAWYMYSNPVINNLLKENKIKVGSREHKDIVIDGAKAIVDQNMTSELIKEQVSKVNSLQDKHLELIKEIFDKNTTSERLQEIQEKNPLMFALVNKLGEKHTQYLQDRIQARNEQKKQFKESIHNADEFANNKNIREYAKNHLSIDIEDGSDLEQAITDQLKEYYIDERRNDIIDRAYVASLETQFKDNLRNNRKAFLSNRFVRSYARSVTMYAALVESKILDSYNNDDQREDALDYAWKLYNAGLTKEDYVSDGIHQLHLYQQQKALSYLSGLVKNRKARLKEIRRITGLDVNTDFLEGMVDAVDEMQKQHADRENALYHNEERKKVGQKEIKYSDLFDDNDLFDDQEDYDTAIRDLFLNKAVHKPQTTIASLYFSGRANPLDLKSALYGSEAEGTEFDDLHTLLEEAIKAQQTSTDLDKEATSAADAIKNRQSALKKSAWAAIKKRLDIAENRRKLARRIYEEDEVVTPYDFEQAADGNQSAQKKILNVSTDEASEAEQALRKKYVGKKRETLDEKKEKVKKRKGKFVEAEAAEQDFASSDKEDTIDVTESSESEEHIASGHEVIVPEPSDGYADTAGEDEIKSIIDEELKLEVDRLHITVDLFGDEYVKTYSDIRKYELTGESELINEVVTGSNPTSWCIPNWESVYPKCESGQVVAVMSADQFKQIDSTYESDKPVYVCIEITKNEESGTTTVTPRFVKRGENDGLLQFFSLEPEMLPSREEELDFEETDDESDTSAEKDDQSDIEPETNLENEDDDSVIQPEPDEGLDVTADSEEDAHDVTVSSDDSESVADFSESIISSAQKEENDEANINDDIVTNGSWVAVDYTDLQFDENGKQLLFDGFALPQDQSNAIMTDLMLLGMSEVDAVTQEELPDGTVIKTIDRRLVATSENSTDLVSQTFFYRPDATDILELKVGGKDVKLNKPIAPGSNLAKKLTEKNWLKNAKKYYIVTRSLEAENVKRGTDPRDAMTVAMVIEDDTNSYIVTLRALGTTVSDGKYTVNAETALRNWLYIKDIDFSKLTGGSIPESNKDKVELFKKVVGERAKEKARAWWSIDHNPDEFEQWWKSGPMRSKYPKSAEDRYNADRAQREQLLHKFWKDARQEFAKPGRLVISDEKIDEQINRLRQQRNAIIDAYLTKTESKNGVITYHFPKEVRTDVVPKEVVLSNGRINSQRDKYGNPVYHPVFAEDASLEEIQSKIENNEVVFGYGHGVYGDKPFVITGVQNATEEYDGKGLSGKIYMMVEGPTGTTVPVMLQEERFDTQQTKSGKTVYLRNTDNLQLCLRMNAQTGFVEYDDTSDTLPSAAEVLFYMLTGKMDTGVATDELRQEIVEFFLHTGPKTILKYGQKTSDANPLNFLASKQISWEKSEEHGYVLNIAMRTERGYELQTFTYDDLFNGSEEAQNTIRSVVQAIATQMHWNTDLSHMRSSINVESHDASGMSFFIRKMIELYGKDTDDVDEYLNQQINILGCPQLSFKVSDFYERADDADVTGDELKAKENVSVFAWMLKNKKVMSDVGELPFAAPFVFGNGVINSGSPSTETFEKVVEEASATSKTEPVILTSPQLESTTDFDLFDLAKYDDFTGNLKSGQAEKYSRQGWYVAKTEEQRQLVLELLDQSKDAKDNGGINDRIMLKPPTSKMKLTEIEQYVKELISRFLEKYNERYPDRKVDYSNITIKPIVLNQIKAQYANKNSVIILDLYKNGTGKVTTRQFSQISQWNSPVTGIFSKEKGKGKIDVVKARKWLQSVLGLQEHQVVVTDALLRSMQNDIVYGVTTTSFDKIIQETIGQISISSQSGLGVEYHEAWHYVNLLLHDNETRQSIYDSYRASHKNLRKKGVTNRDIEEAMAEDFRRYMLMQEDDSIVGKIRRFFNNVLDMLIASRKEGYRIAYQAIQRGEYKGLQLDKHSLDQFKSAWKNEAPLEYFVSGVNELTSKNLTNIATHHELFEATDAIVNEILSKLNLDSIEKIREYSGTSFDKLLDIVDELIGRQADEHSIEILTTIRNNPEIIRRKLIEHMMDLGIRAKIKKMSDVIQNKHIELGEDPDPELLGNGEEEHNKWDILDLTVSKKDNAALRTKMFLRAIPKYHIEYYTDGTSDHIPESSRYDVPKYVSFDEAWNKILNELWSCTSFDKKINGEYSKNSIMGRVIELSKSDPFFYGLKEKLESLDYEGECGDTLLKSQIFTTISSNKNPVAYVQIENARRFQSAGMIDDAFITSEVEYELDDNGVESDRHRMWRLMNDTTIQVARNIPRKWSKAAAVNGLLDFNRKTGKSVISRQYAKIVQKQYDDVIKTLNKYDKKTGLKTLTNDQVYDILNGENGIKSNIIAMLNTLGVPIDLLSFDVFVRSFDSNKELTPLLELEQIRKLMTTTAAGTIGGVVTHISQNAGDEEFAPMGRGKYVRAIDEVFNNYDEKSQIGKLALAYNYIHPQLSEYTVKDPKGNRLYPINMANETTDKTNALNDRESGIAKEMRKSPYCKHSIILDAADAVSENDPSSNITLNTFVGLKDGNSENGTDYFGVTALEDYLCKMFMTESDQLVFPTMADKKTWYSLTLGNSKLSHDTILCGPIDKDLNARIYEAYEKENPYSADKYKSKTSWERAARRWYYSLSHDNATRLAIYDAAEHDLQNRKNTNVRYLRFGDVTIDRFCGYFLDELNALIQYYSKDNIQALVEDANKRKVNFHGKVKNGRMDFSGNGGKFRYFYGIGLNTTSIFGNVDASGTLNLNQQIEALFKIQQQIEAGKLVSLTTNKSGETVTDDMFKNIPIGVLLNNNEEGSLDGFELVREYLQNLRKQIRKNNKYSNELKDAINDHLIQCARKELQMMSRPGDPLQICRYDQKSGRYLPTSIPSQLFDRYVEQLGEEGLTSDYGIYEKTGDDFANEAAASHALFSLVANHVANSMTSVIEIEKIYAGDPAFYKEKKNGTETVEIESFELAGRTFNATVEVEDLWDIYSDKIKRLGGLLSPGGKLRLDYSQDELNRDPNLFSSHYTNLNVEDIEVSSIFLKQIEGQFRTLLIVDYIRSNNPNEFKSFIKELQEGRDRKNAKLKELGKKQLPKITYEGAIDILYSNEKYANRFYELIKNKPFGNSTVEKNIERNLQQQLSPYRRNADNNEDGINVSDAQVFIRPELYRKMRIALGDWSFEPDPETGYCDEEAYRLIESSDDWMKNPDTYQLVRKFQLYVLKMSYFQNKPTQITSKANGNLPIYNKMAIFPLFKFHASTEVGHMLYERMNRKGEELDMVSFKSAVKVGAVQKAARVITEQDGTPSDEQTAEALSKLNEQLNKHSNNSIDYTTDQINVNDSEDTLAVEIQDLHNIRLQLNTHAHESEVRAIGTQMFKIAFSNLIDDAMYGQRTGKQVKEDIIRCINKLTNLGVNDLRLRFFKNGKLDDKEVENFIIQIVKNNGLGSSAEDIIANGGVAAGIMTRQVFENSISAIVNSEVVDITTNGGTAIQQSIFGFVGHDRSEIAKDGLKYRCYNDGKELKWIVDKNSVEILLTMNFFKAVIPKEEQTSYEHMRQWLIDHDVIKGLKSIEYWKHASEEDLHKHSLLLSKIIEMDFSVMTLNALKANGIVTLKDLIDNKYKLDIDKRVGKKIMSELGDFLESINLGWDTDTDIKIKEVYSNPKPFGIGYRIPTQGMSSMFSFTVADVLPEQVGDLIVVPREFTAQTGSDFDIDKLYLATMCYKDGVLEQETEGEEATKGQIANTLLQNYMDIICDRRNFANARGSIDVITKKLKSELLKPVLQAKTSGYIQGMYDLLPSFQALRKMEFSVGKTGIGPFALNITNLALTLYTHLTFNYDEQTKEYGFKDLDCIYGKDGLRVSDWLSAMVNAHVDVAKDPYVFDLNVNQFTYNHANFLLRAGMGMSTFTFLAQPALKDYANTMNNAGGIYGGNLDGLNPESESNSRKRKQLLELKYHYYTKILKSILKNNEELHNTGDKNVLTKDDVDAIKSTIEYFDYLCMTAKQRKSAGITKAPQFPLNRVMIFNEEFAKSAILNYHSSDLSKRASSIMFQLCALASFEELQKYAQGISDLVRVSQVDTKKFGNNIADHMDFVNEYETFKCSSNLWTINDEQFIKSVPVKKNKEATVEDISKHALDRYFSSMYLDKKLYNAVKYTKAVLRHLTFTATDGFDQLYTTVCGILNGSRDYVDVHGNTITKYNKMYGKDTVQTVSGAIDNIVRFNSFMNVGTQIYNAAVESGDTFMIDFTIGGNQEAVVNKVRELLFGTKEQGSIFERVSDLLAKMRKDLFNEAYDGLTDDTHITNELLLYLNPQSPSSKYPIGRMLLSMSQTEANGDQKRHLISAFSQLLSHKNPEIRNLAKDLAFYAYYSTYDQNTANSFFDLVPAQYRAQYDRSLKQVLHAMSVRSKEDPSIHANAVKAMVNVNSDTLDDVDIMRLGAMNIIDTMSRNFWYDDNIVKVYYTDKYSDTKSNVLTSYGGELLGHSILDAQSGRMFPTYIATTKTSPTAMYIKIRKGSGTFLYRKVGSILRSYESEGKLKKAAPFAIYVCVPKAGLHQNGANQYELYANAETQSIFEQNRLPSSDFAEDVVRKDIEERVSDANTSQWELQVEWNNEQVPSVYRSTNVQVYEQDVKVDEKTTLVVAGLRVFGGEKAPEAQAQKTADITINVVQKDLGDDNRVKPTVNNPNVVDVVIGAESDNIVKSILQLNKEAVTIHFTTPHFLTQYEVSQKEIDNWVDEQILKFENTIEDSVEDEDRDQLIAAKKVELQSGNTAKAEIIQDKMNLFVLNVVLKIIASGIKIDHLSASATEGKTTMAKAVANANAAYRSDFASDKSFIYVHHKISSKRRAFSAFLNSIDNEASVAQRITTETLAEDISAVNDVNSEDERVMQIIKENTTPANKTRVNKFANMEAVDAFDATSSVSEENKDNADNLSC